MDPPQGKLASEEMADEQVAQDVGASSPQAEEAEGNEDVDLDGAKTPIIHYEFCNENIMDGATPPIRSSEPPFNPDELEI